MLAQLYRGEDTEPVEVNYEGFLSLETIETLFVHVGKKKCLSAIEWDMVVGANRTGLCQELQHSWVFHMCIKNGSPPNGHPANLTQLWEALESTWDSILVEHFRHLVESIPQ